MVQVETGSCALETRYSSVVIAPAAPAPSEGLLDDAFGGTRRIY